MSVETRYKCDLCLCLLGDFRPGRHSNHLAFDRMTSEDGEDIIDVTADATTADIHVCYDCASTITGLHTGRES